MEVFQGYSEIILPIVYYIILDRQIEDVLGIPNSDEKKIKNYYKRKD